VKEDKLHLENNQHKVTLLLIASKVFMRFQFNFWVSNFDSYVLEVFLLFQIGSYVNLLYPID
jgi:hypothetical protein